MCLKIPKFLKNSLQKPQIFEKNIFKKFRNFRENNFKTPQHFEKLFLKSTNF